MQYTVLPCAMHKDTFFMKFHLVNSANLALNSGRVCITFIFSRRFLSQLNLPSSVKNVVWQITFCEAYESTYGHLINFSQSWTCFPGMYMLLFPPWRRYHHNLWLTDGLTMLANWLEIVAILVHYQSSYNTSLTIKPSDIASTRYQNISQRYIIRIRVNAFSFLNGLCILFQD